MIIALHKNARITPAIRAELVQYAYDATSRRIQRQHLTPTNTQTTTYHYDAWNVIHEKTTHSNTIPESVTTPTETTHHWGLDLSNTLQGAGGVGGLLSSKYISGETIQCHSHTYDANGNTSALIKNTGEVSAHYQYDPFGNTLTVADSTAFANPYRFSTKSWDVQAELMYYGSRFYCSANGRWLNRDPIAENGRKNLFEFAMNNANDMIDYNGKQAMPPSFERPRWPWPSEIDSCDEARKIVADYIASLKEDGNPEDNYSIELFEDFLSKTGEPFVASDEQVYQIRNSKQFRNGLEKEIESKIKKVCRGKRKGESVSMDLDGNFRVEYTMWSNSSLWLAIGGGTIYYSIFMTIKCKCSAMGCGTFEMRDFYSFEPGGYRRYHRAYNAFHYLQLRCGYKPFDSTAVGGVCYNDGDVDNWG